MTHVTNPRIAMEILHRDEARHNFFWIDIDPEMSRRWRKERPFWKSFPSLIGHQYVQDSRFHESILCKFRYQWVCSHMQSIASIWLFDGIWGIWFTAQRFFALLWGGDVQDSEKTSMQSKLHLTNHHSSQQNVSFCSSQLSKDLNNYHLLVAILKKKGHLTFFQPSPSPPYLGTNDVPFKTKRLGFGPPT